MTNRRSWPRAPSTGHAPPSPESVETPRHGDHRLVSGRLTAVDVQCLPRDERGLLEIKNPLDDVRDLTHTPQGMQAAQLHIGRGIMPGRLDDAERDRVHPHPARRVFDG